MKQMKLFAVVFASALTFNTAVRSYVRAAEVARSIHKNHSASVSDASALAGDIILIRSHTRRRQTMPTLAYALPPVSTQFDPLLPFVSYATSPPLTSSDGFFRLDHPPI